MGWVVVGMMIVALLAGCGTSTTTVGRQPDEGSLVAPPKMPTPAEESHRAKAEEAHRLRQEQRERQEEADRQRREARQRHETERREREETEPTVPPQDHWEEAEQDSFMSGCEAYAPAGPHTLKTTAVCSCELQYDELTHTREEEQAITQALSDGLPLPQQDLENARKCSKARG